MARNGFDVGAIASSPALLASFALAIPGWFTAFIGQIIVESKFEGSGSAAGIAWFNIFLELFLIAAALWVLATGSLGAHRFQIAVLLAVATVFAILATDGSIYAQFINSPSASRAMGAGWLLLSIVNLFWLLFFTASEDTYFYHLVGSSFTTNRGGSPNGLGARRSMIGRPQSNRSYGSEHAHMNGSAAPVVGATMNGNGGGPIYAPPMDAKRSSGGSVHSSTHQHTGVLGGGGGAPPPMSSMPASPPNMSADVQAQAKAMYGYKRNEDDPNEISFDKNEILQIIDRSGKWWQVRRANGDQGIAPSNYLQLVEA